MQSVANVIVLASLYCLICCGYVLVYRASRVLNLAHGEIMTLGGYFLLSITLLTTGNPLVSLGLAVCMSLLLGLIIYFALMRFMAGESVFAAVLVTVSLGILLRGLMKLIWTAQSWHPLQYLGLTNTGHTLFGKAVISTFGLAAILSAILLYVTL
jgi:branched-chain amino acid transport system permease protein